MRRDSRQSERFHPQVEGLPDSWLRLYNLGWRQIADVVDTGAASPPLILRAIAAGRWAWPLLPLAESLDALLTTEAPRLGSLCAWTCWHLYCCDGDRERLSERYELVISASDQRIGTPATQHADANALVKTARVLERTQPEIGPAPSSLPSIDWFPLLWVEALRESGADDDLALLITLQMNRFTGSLRSANAAIDAVSLVLDGVAGLSFFAENEDVSWRVPARRMQIRGLAMGATRIDLTCTADQAGGAEVTVVTTGDMTIELSTAETLYLEHLSPGRHEITLTVLDRTDVRA